MRRRVAPRPPREGDQLVPVSHRLVPEQDTRPRLESDPSLSRVMTDGPTGSMPRLGPWPPSRAETEHERRTKRFHRDESDAPRLARSRPGSLSRRTNWERPRHGDADLRFARRRGSRLRFTRMIAAPRRRGCTPRSHLIAFPGVPGWLGMRLTRRTSMKKWGPVALAVALSLGFATPSYGAGGKKELLQMYTAKVDRAAIARLAREGYDVSAAKQVEGGVRVDLVLTSRERDRLKAEGVALSLLRNRAGLTVQQQAAAQSAYGFNVWRSYDEPGGIRDQLYAIAQRNPSIVKLIRTGTSIQGREILALKV